jgi:hypothetical protein
MYAPHLYNGSKVTFMTPLNTQCQDIFLTSGGAVGTLTLVDGEADAYKYVGDIDGGDMTPQFYYIDF